MTLSSTYSEVTGADLTDFEAFNTYTVTLVAKDSSDVYLTTGGDKPRIWIKNE